MFQKASVELDVTDSFKAYCNGLEGHGCRILPTFDAAAFDAMHVRNAQADRVPDESDPVLSAKLPRFADMGPFKDPVRVPDRLSAKPGSMFERHLQRTVRPVAESVAGAGVYKALVSGSKTVAGVVVISMKAVWQSFKNLLRRIGQMFGLKVELPPDAGEGGAQKQAKVSLAETEGQQPVSPMRGKPRDSFRG